MQTDSETFNILKELSLCHKLLSDVKQVLNFRILISLQPNAINLRYFKLYDKLEKVLFV